jgi:hypothetical protein
MTRSVRGRCDRTATVSLVHTESPGRGLPNDGWEYRRRTPNLMAGCRCEVQTVQMRANHPRKELLDHLIVWFGVPGKRAVEFLTTARRIVETSLLESARSPETVAYCLRETLKTITSAESDGTGGRWSSISRRVVTEARRFEIAASAGQTDDESAQARDDLLAAVAELESFHGSDGIHQKRLVAALVERTGAFPFASGLATISEYQRLIEDLDTGLHGTVTSEEAVKLYNRATDIVHRLFVPPTERFPAIEELALIPNPTKTDVLKLRRLVISPIHLRQFVQSLLTTAWLRLPDAYDLFDPPSEPAYWPAFEAVAVLAPRDPVGIAAWLTDAYDRCSANAPQVAHLFRAATSGGHPAPETAVRILRRHGAIKTVRDQARWFVMGCEADDLQVIEFTANPKRSTFFTPRSFKPHQKRGEF